MPGVDIESFRAGARAWLAERLEPAVEESAEWGVGSDDVSVFHALSHEAERALLDRVMAWQQEKCDAGFGAITWPPEYGGQGLTDEHESVFGSEEERFAAPDSHEAFSVTVNLVAPTVLRYGTDSQKDRFLRPFVRAEELCVQLFSEPGAGSDLAAVATRAERDGDGWTLSGQKVWTSGAEFASWGEIITRTDPDVVKHQGMTAFLLPLDAPGVEVRPLRQMSGGSSFCEVFLTDVRIPDELRLGPVGEGWRVALTTLGFERSNSRRMRQIGGNWARVRSLAEHLGRTSDPVVRQRLVEVYIGDRLGELIALRANAGRREGQAPGPEGSISKLAWVRQLDRISSVASDLLGPALVADTGEWGTYAWAAHVLGAVGYHIAGGSDQVQRTILGERVLGLPAEPRVDRVAWRDLPR